VWKKKYYFTSKHADHIHKLFCMKCKKWIKGGEFSHIKQHDDRWHLDVTVDQTGSSGGSNKVQAKVNQVYQMASEALASLHAYLVGAWLCLLCGEEGGTVVAYARTSDSITSLPSTTHNQTVTSTHHLPPRAPS